MVRYRGPRVRIIRRLGLLPGLTKKVLKIELKLPGNMVRLFLQRHLHDHRYLMIIENVFLKTKNYVLIMELLKSN